MKKIAAAVLMSGALVLSSQVAAQEAKPVASLVDDIKNLDSRHVAAVVVGAVGGAVVLHWVVGGTAASWIGAGAGALVGDWYYVEKMSSASAAGLSKARVFAREAMAEVDAGLIEARAVVYRQIEALR